MFNFVYKWDLILNDLIGNFFILFKCVMQVVKDYMEVKWLDYFVDVFFDGSLVKVLFFIFDQYY